MGKINLYTLVTNDKYEIPVKCDIRKKEVAEFLGITENAVNQRVFKPVKKSKYKIVISGRVVFDKYMYNKRYALTHDRSEYYKERYRRLKGANDENNSGGFMDIPEGMDGELPFN